MSQQRSRHGLGTLYRRPSASKFDKQYPAATAMALPTVFDLQPRSRTLAQPVESAMTTSVLVAPPNSLALVAGSPTSTGPATMGGLSIAATRSVIAISCLMFQDG